MKVFLFLLLVVTFQVLVIRATKELDADNESIEDIDQNEIEQIYLAELVKLEMLVLEKEEIEKSNENIKILKAKKSSVDDDYNEDGEYILKEGLKIQLYIVLYNFIFHLNYSVYKLTKYVVTILINIIFE